MAALTIRIGDTWASPTWAVLVDGAALDLNDGWSVRAQARRRAADTAVVWSWSTADIGQALVTPVGGEPVVTSTVRLRHAAADTVDWDPWHGVFDVEISKGPISYTIVTGSVRAISDVTR